MLKFIPLKIITLIYRLVGFMKNKKIGIVLCGLFLAGCGSEDSDNSASAEDINNLVKQTNFSNGFPTLDTDKQFGFAPLEQRGVVRFDTTSQIPLYYVSKNGNQPPQNVIDGVTRIESRLGDIFTDFMLISEDVSQYRDDGIPDQSISNYTYNHNTFTNTHGIRGGVIISLDSAFFSHQYGDAKSMCANASIAPYSGSMGLVVDDNTHTYTEDNLLWVNMGNNHGCSWDSNIVTHEIAHAMGMYTHLDGYFGSWSVTAMNVLATMYSNNAGTPYDSLLPDMQ